jgi:hypothetical protein
MLGLRNTVELRMSLGGALAVTRRQLSLDPVTCDEHLRRQTDYVGFENLDEVVELRDLDAFFARNGWGPLPRRNEAVKPVGRDERVSAEIRDLYAADLLLASRHPA